jgi:hypothetical protein
MALCLVLLAMPAWAGPFSQSERRRQREMFTGAVAGALPAGDCIYVNSVSGRNGSRGDSPDRALATLARALAVASAGDTIILNPGGSETVTATIAVNLARIKIICPVANPDAGFTITAAGTVDLITVSAAGVHLEGLKLVHTGTATTTAGVLTTAAADQLHIENCLFDDTAVTTTFTGYGVEITNDCDQVEIVNCRFKDNHRAVLFATETGKNLIDARIRGCEFWVGQATAFGILSAPAGSGTVRGLRISGCLFRELDGDGTTATDAWDGSDGTNAASGPISFSAAVDQWTISDCWAETALTSTFGNLNAINGGAVGEMFDVSTASGSEDSGTLNDGETNTLHGKLGTDTEFNDRSVFDLLAGDGPSTFPGAAAAANDVSLAEVVRYIQESQIGTIVNAGGTATIGGVWGDMANSPAVTRFANIQTEADKIGTIVNAGGTATIGGVFGDMANSPVVTRLANIQTEADKIGTIVNAGGSATIGGVWGDMANSPAVTRFANIQTEVDLIGSIDTATTDVLHGKLGTDTEMDDNSWWDYLIPVTANGVTDIDISTFNYTAGYVTLLTVTPAAGQNLIDCVIDLDWNLATDGWDTTSTVSDTLDILVQTKTDGTNYRFVTTGTQVTSTGAGTLAVTADGQRFSVGMVSNAATLIVKVKMSAEVADADIPYRVTYRGATPTITAVAAD